MDQLERLRGLEVLGRAALDLSRGEGGKIPAHLAVQVAPTPADPPEVAALFLFDSPRANAAFLALFDGFASGNGRALADVARERSEQDRQWGGPSHDDAHSNDTWLRTLGEHLARAGSIRESFEGAAAPHASPLGAMYRAQVVKIAAVALAHVEALDRKLGAEQAPAPSAPPARTAAPVVDLRDAFKGEVARRLDEAARDAALATFGPFGRAPFKRGDRVCVEPPKGDAFDAVILNVGGDSVRLTGGSIVPVEWCSLIVAPSNAGDAGHVQEEIPNG